MFKSGASSAWLVVQPVATHMWHYWVASGMWHVHTVLWIALLIITSLLWTLFARQYWGDGFFCTFCVFSTAWMLLNVFIFSKVCISSRLHAFILDLNIVLLTFTLIPQRTCWKVVQVILFFLKLSPESLNRSRNKRQGLLWVFCLLHFKISSFLMGKYSTLWKRKCFKIHA